MIRWVDVNESDWYFNEITEACNTLLEDGEPLIQGIAYNAYWEGTPYLYEEQKGVKGKTIFTLTKKLIPTPANPLLAFIDGAQTIIKSCTDNATGTSDVEFYVSPPSGSTISFTSMGKPDVDRFGKPKMAGGTPTYPNKKLDWGDFYYYEPLSRQYQEYLYAFGQKLFRVDVPAEEWTIPSNGQQLAAKYIGNKQDRYIVSPADLGGWIYLPYSLDGVTCRFTYNSLENEVIKMRGGNFQAHGENVIFNNRFFPKAYITHLEAVVLLDRLRKSFYSRFTDVDAPTNQTDETFITYRDQKVIKLNSKVDQLANGVTVKLDGVVKTRPADFNMFDDHTILWNTPLTEGREVTVSYHKTTSVRFKDVGRTTSMFDNETSETISVNGSESVYWAESVLSLEEETLANNSEWLINGRSITNFTNGSVTVDHLYNPVPGTDPEQYYFMPQTILTRAEGVALLNRFRKWCIEKFK